MHTYNRSNNILVKENYYFSFVPLPRDNIFLETKAQAPEVGSTEYE